MLLKKRSPTSILGTLALTGIVISSMIGGGIFSLPQNMVASASAGAVMLAWMLSGIGIFFIANTFKTLSIIRPDLKASIYTYSREGFGPYVGFTIAWGYWLCQIFGNVDYAVITMDALNYFFPPYFAGGNTIPAILLGSLLIWIFNYIVLRGIRQASFVNIIGAVCTLIPLLLFILITARFFKFSIFKTDFWGTAPQHTLGSIGSQLKSTMLVTLWAFIGIEGAVVISGRAANLSSVGKATILGFSGCLLIYVLLSLLPFGSLFQYQLAKIADPSTAGVLNILVGKWGEVLMNTGLLIAVLTSWLSWTILASEIPYAAAKNGTFPECFAIENSKHAPSFSLFMTSGLMQITMLLVYFSSNAWNTMLEITGVMVLPAYLTSSLFLVKFSLSKKYPKQAAIKAHIAMITSLLGSLYSLWLIYAGGLQHLFMVAILLALGIPFYVDSGIRHKQEKTFLNRKEILKMTIVALAALLAIFLFSANKIHL